MRLYTGSSREFSIDTKQNRIADKLRSAYENYYCKAVTPSELNSWINSLQFIEKILEQHSLLDTMLILEYELPYSSERIDCVLFGKNEGKRDNVVVIELKQWSSVEGSGIEENVITIIGHARQMVPHPSAQVRGYHYFLKDFIPIFEEKESVDLSSCVYCHNYSRFNEKVLFAEEFKNLLSEFPVFAKEDSVSLGKYLEKRLSKGNGLELFNRFINSEIKPSKRLVDHAKGMIKGQKVFTLLSDQITTNNTIIDRARVCSETGRKSIIIVRGGPGTGKSVIALNALIELLNRGLAVFHATGSAAFTTTLRKIAGVRAAALFKYFNSFSNYKENAIDVLVCDEAHRIRKTSNDRYTRREMRSTTPQIEELMRIAKLSIFFLDENQIVKPDEVGNVRLILDTAERLGVKKDDIFNFELKTQFRCSGSDGYLNWVDNTLEIRQTANIKLTKEEKMEFKFFDSPHSLYEAIKKKNEEKPNSARLVAGFCWPWSNPDSQGNLKKDVVIGDFQMTWEGKPGKKLAKGIPPAPLWAFDPKGVNQIGCIYTIQGFEFDYVGVIFAGDLVYDDNKKEWVGHPEVSCDGQFRFDRTEYTRYAKNIYRTLLTRGMKGCYVYFMDKVTEEFFKSRIEKEQLKQLQVDRARSRK